MAEEATGPARLDDRTVTTLAALLCAVAVLGPIRSAWELSRVAYGPFSAAASLHVSDVPVAGLVVVSARMWARHRRRPTAATALLAVLGAWAIVALALHPSAPGLLLVFRLLGAAAIAASVVEIAGTTHAHVVVRCLLGATAVQGVLAVAQVLNDGPLGLTFLGETQRWTYLGDHAAGQGTFNHPYILAGWTLVVFAMVMAIRRRGAPDALDDVATLVVGAIMGITYSRAALLALAIAAPCVALAVRRRAVAPRTIVLFVVGAVAAGAVFSGGWVDKARATATAAASRSVEAASTDRGVLLGDAIEIIEEHPAAGVGPSRYLAGLQRVEDVAPDDFKPVHNVPLLATAENGLPAAVILTALLAALMLAAVRSGPLTVALGALYAPFLLFDHFPYYSVQGLIATGLWIGVVDAVTSGRVAVDAPWAAIRRRRARSGSGRVP